jgi:perosamine synthetase
LKKKLELRILYEKQSKLHCPKKVSSYYSQENKMIPVSKPYLSSRETLYVNDAIASGWVSSLGEYIEKFECEFANFCGVEYALTVSNGTVGLHLALVGLNIGAGDEVIIPDLTFVATANAVSMSGAKPVMVDVCRETYCIDPQKIAAAITERTRAIIPVHLYGHPANMAAILEIAQRFGLKVIEDAAEAHGASINGKRVGGIGNCGVFSFYGNKILTTGEGGMIVTSDACLYERLKFLRDHAMSKEIRYWHTEVGFNYRMTNVQAALGLAQLEQIDYFLAERSHQLERYRSNLLGTGIELNPSISVEPVNWITCAYVAGLGRIKRDRVIALLKDKGVDSRPFFFPLSRLPMYSGEVGVTADKLSESGFNLPTYVGLKDQEIDKVCSVFIDCLNHV